MISPRLPCLALFLAIVMAPIVHADGLPETLLLQDPDVSNDHVVFVYAQDLWVVAREGGTARRLTSDVGAESRPRFSPDGQHIAFTGQYEGNTDVYIMPVSGGLPKRLTWHSGSDSVQDWTPDGQSVLFTSSRYGGAPVNRLFEVSKEGGQARRLALPKVSHASMNKAASHIAYTPIPDAFRSWKRYRGGRTTPIWIYDVKTHGVEQIPHINATDTFPAWLDGQVYFASDRDGHMNMWSFKPGSKSATQVTKYIDFDIRNLSAGAGLIVYEQAGALHLFNPKEKATKRLHIMVPNDGLMAKARWQSVRGFVRGADISPNGKRAVFEARGEIITVPKDQGHSRNITKSPGVHDRSPRWAPNGQKIAWFSDRSGEYQLLLQDQKGRGKIRSFDLKGAGFYYALVWSPNSKKIAYTDKAGALFILTIASGKVDKITQSRGSLGVYFPNPVWSPDSRFIAFERRDAETTYDRICILDIKFKAIFEITDSFSTAGDPAFSKDGKYLFFTASINSGPKRFGLDMNSSAAKRSSNNLYFVVLSKMTKNPLAKKNDEASGISKAKAASKKTKKMGKSGGKSITKASSAPKKTVIHADGISQRILALPLPSGRYRNLQCSKTNLYFIDGGSSSLKSFSFKTKKATVASAGVRDYRIAADGISVLTRGSSWGVMKLPGKATKSLPIDKVKIKVDPQQEWPQILRETWRLQRDYFYDEQLHGVDWPAMWERWKPFLPHVRHRSDLNLLMKELIGELCCGHQYVSGGDMPRADSGVSVGVLGADFEIKDGRYHIQKIYKGQNWNPGLRAPLTEPGINAAVGDALIAVNGVELQGRQNLWSAFENTAGKVTELTLQGKDGKKKTVVLVPLSSDRSLRSLDWIEQNRSRVKKLSGGRLAYVYMPDTGGRGMASFDRDFYAQVNKEGLILDERYNRGGKVADYVIGVLSRKPYCYWMTREKWLGRTPFATITGPKVMVINERAGSGGDAMPWMFKNNKLGPLVGTRTWGGLVGISGYPSMMDGGRVTSASFGVMDNKGRWAVENVGVAPDYEVVEKPKDIIEGRDPQLEKAVELAMAALKKQKASKKPAYYPPKKR
jgi:tricorn protease